VTMVWMEAQSFKQSPAAFCIANVAATGMGSLIPVPGDRIKFIGINGLVVGGESTYFR
jgi:hypothetical protein